MCPLDDASLNDVSWPWTAYRSRIHECTISLRFLGIESSQTWGSPLQPTVTELRNCKRLREFEEIDISRQCCRGDWEWQEGKLLRLLSGFRPRIRPQAVDNRNSGTSVGGGCRHIKLHTYVRIYCTCRGIKKQSINSCNKLEHDNQKKCCTATQYMYEYI
jgi:hypothetical protein